VIAGHGFCIRQVDYTSAYRRPAHSHDTNDLTLVFDGGFRETVSGRDEQAGALSVALKPAGTVHANVAGPRGARTVMVQIPEGSPLLPERTAFRHWRWLHAGPGVRPLLALRRALLDPAAGPDPRETMLELLGEIVDATDTRPRQAPPWIRRVREALDDRAPECERVETLAGIAGVHPVSLTRAFRRAYGVPVTVYRRKLRLRRAVAEVVGTDRGLASIAHAAGYSDHAHLCREVRGATGLTPSGLREVARG
jgi:AraC family transcriptional regulator